MKAISFAAALALLASGGPSAAQAPEPRCLKDALERWYCPKDAKGVAVTDTLGEIVCAPGSCVKVEAEWHCSDVSGGQAELTPEGPVCEGECRKPRAVDCESVPGPP